MTSNPYYPPGQTDTGTPEQSLSTRLLQHYRMLTAVSYAALVVSILALYLALMSGYSGTLPGGYVMPYSEPLRSLFNIGALGLMGLTVVSSVAVCRFGTTSWRIAALPSAITSSLFLLFCASSLLNIWITALLNWGITTLF